MKSAVVILASALVLMPASSEAVSISFTDAPGDQTGIVDVLQMTLDFSDATGAYTIDITADAAKPFLGAFRININLFNASLDEFFQDTFNDFDLLTPTTVMTLSGINGELTDWLPSHAIAASSFDGLGEPSGTSFFRTSVADLPFSPVCDSEDIIGSSTCLTAGLPEPRVVYIVALGLIGLALGLRLR